MKVTAKFKPVAWDEKEVVTISEAQGITRVSATFEFEGDIIGKSKVEYTMFYGDRNPKDPHAGHATYLGYQRMEATMGGKTGSFVLEDCGTFEGRTAKSELTIITDTGVGDFIGISGRGKYRADETGSHFEIEYSFE